MALAASRPVDNRLRFCLAVFGFAVFGFALGHGVPSSVQGLGPHVFDGQAVGLGPAAELLVDLENEGVRAPAAVVGMAVVGVVFGIWLSFTAHCGLVLPRRLG